MESDRALQVQNKRQVMPTGNTTSSSLCIKHIRKVRRCLGGGPSDRLAAQACLGIVLLRALVLASTSRGHWAH